MFAKPQAEHQWLDKLIGEWNVQSECIMGPDQPPQKGTATLTCRSMGGLWIIADGKSETPEGDPFDYMITLGYDPAKQQFVGSFIASVMTHMWPYSGKLDKSGKRLPLDSTGPKFDGSGMGEYQDIIEIVDDNHWVMKSQLKGDDGQWVEFMTAHHRRK